MASVDVSYVASGFHEDCINLWKLFKDHCSSSYGAFAKAWKDMKFSLIFTCRKTFAELLEFSEESLNIAKQFVLSSNEFIEQIFGLYLLYGLYYKVPVDNIKIRVTLKEWEIFLSFHQHIKDEKLYDASYIFVKLVTDNAFHHCLFASEYGLEKIFKARQDYPSENPYSLLQYIVNDIETGELAKLQELSTAYEEQKAKLVNSSSKNKLQLFDTNFLVEMIDEIETFQEKRHLFVGLKKRTKEINSLFKVDKIKHCDKIRPKLGHGFDTDSSDGGDDYDDNNYDEDENADNDDVDDDDDGDDDDNDYDDDDDNDNNYNNDGDDNDNDNGNDYDNDDDAGDDYDNGDDDDDENIKFF